MIYHMFPDNCRSEARSAVASTRIEQHPSHRTRGPCRPTPGLSDRQQSGGIIPHPVNHSLALLRMGKELSETC